MDGPVTGAGDRAAAAVRALDRAQEATSAALRLLAEADAVDWSGPGAAAFRAALATLLDDVRRVHVRLRGAEAAAVDHAGALRAQEALAEAAARSAGFPASLLTGLLPPPRTGLLPDAGPPGALAAHRLAGTGRPIDAPDRWGVP